MNRMRQRGLVACTATVAAVVMTGCGGGGGSSSPTSAAAPSSAAAASPTSAPSGSTGAPAVDPAMYDAFRASWDSMTDDEEAAVCAAFADDPQSAVEDSAAAAYSAVQASDSAPADKKAVPLSAYLAVYDEIFAESC